MAEREDSGLLSSTWRAWAEEGLWGEIRWKWASRQEQATLRPRGAPSRATSLRVEATAGVSGGDLGAAPFLSPSISLPLSLWPPSWVIPAPPQVRACPQDAP